MTNNPQYDVALSFAGEDRKYAEGLHRALTGRGVRVFYDADVEHELWGQDLYEYLDEIYRKRAKYCVMFLSAAYARKLWTSHERKSAQARAFREREAYILPVRIDDTEIPGVLPTVAYLDLNQHSIQEIAELIVKKLDIPSHERALDTRNAEVRGTVELAFRSILDPDIEHLLATMSPFLKWHEPELLSSLPVSIQWPPVVASWISQNCRIVETGEWPSGISLEARARTRMLFVEQLANPQNTRLALGLKICSAVIRALATDHYANAGLNRSEMNLVLSSYISAEMSAHVLQLVSMRLIGMEYPSWMKSFYGFESNYGCRFTPGLVLSARNTGQEKLLWIDADFGEDTRITKYLYVPASVLIRHDRPLESKNFLLTVVMPQLIAMAAEKRIDWSIASAVAKYPSRFYLRPRSEFFVDAETLAEPQHQRDKFRERLRNWCREKISEGAFEELGVPELAAKKMDANRLFQLAENRVLSRTGIGWSGS